jgi:hypothetical protein
MKLYSKLTGFFAAAGLIVFSGCLKDKDYDNGVNQSLRNRGDVNIVSIALTAASTDNHLVLALNDVDKDTIINLIPVQVAATNGAPSDVKVTLSLNPALVGSYNELNGTVHDITPTSIYEIQNPSDGAGGYVVTIPSGSNTGYLTAKINSHNFIGFDYALGFQITQAPAGYVISSNLGSGIIAIGVKNKYDGHYSMDLTLAGWAAYGIADGVTNTWAGGVDLITAGSSSLTISTSEGGTLQPAFTASGGKTAFGATAPQYNFDATDAMTSVVNLAPDDGRGRTFFLNTAAGPSGYNATSKTITAHYIMTQNGRPNQQIDAVFTYIGPR